MDIVLDSNIFYRDLSLNSYNFQILFNFLDRSKSNLIVPQIVYEEVINLYSKDLFTNLKSYENLKKMLFLEPQESIEKIIIEEQVSKYSSYFKSKCLDNNRGYIAKYDDTFFKSIVKRAIQKVKPFSNNEKNDKGFRERV